MERGILPGVQEVVKLIGHDERRHMAWGTFTCRRHIAADEANWEVVQQTLDQLLQPALSIIEVTFDEFEREGREMGVEEEESPSVCGSFVVQANICPLSGETTHCRGHCFGVRPRFWSRLASCLAPA